MARENIDLYNIGDSPEDLQEAILTLRQDFDSHNHDGINSKSFQTLITETIIGRSAIIGGYRLFDAIVGQNSADYKTIADALAAGKTRIFIRNGTYSNEPKWAINNANTTIIGESLGGVIINFAQDTVNARSIYVNATRFGCSNLKLTSYETGQQTLFEFSASGSYPTIKECILRNRQGKFFDGNAIQSNLFGTFQNLYFDCLGTSNATLMIIFYYINDSKVINCKTDMNFSNSGFTPVNSCSNTEFIGCNFEMDASRAVEYTISSSSTCFFSDCYFYAYQIAANSNFFNCFFENNGNSPASYFISIMNAGLQFNNNRIKSANGDNIFTITAANIQANNNYFDGGKSMVFEPSVTAILGIQFCNNTWVSGYTVATIDLRLGSVGHTTDNANIAYNIIRNNSNSFTPTITNNSAGCNVTGNQLIKG